MLLLWFVFYFVLMLCAIHLARLVAKVRRRGADAPLIPLLSVSTVGFHSPVAVGSPGLRRRLLVERFGLRRWPGDMGFLKRDSLDGSGTISARA